MGIQLPDAELERIRYRDELMEPVRFHTQAELDRRVLLSELFALRSRLGLPPVSSTQDRWARQRTERDMAAAAHRAQERAVADVEDI